MKKKRLIIALYYYHPYVSGLSIHAKRIAEALAKRGFNVTIVTTNFDKKQKAEEVINNVRIIRAPVLFSLGKGVISPQFVTKILKISKGVDYVNLMLPMTESGIISLLLPKSKLIISYICDLNLGEGLINKTISILTFASMKLAMRRTPVVFPLSKDYLSESKMKKFVSKAEGVNPIIKSEDFKKVDSEELFKKLGVRKNEVKIGFVGRIVYEKGIDYLLESIKYIKKEIPQFKIIIVGDYSKVAGGSVKDKLDVYIKKYSQNILFTGFLPEKSLKEFYSGLDVFVLPSIDPLEAFGIVQVESMLCGTPVVASILPGVREIIQKTNFGLLAKPKDSKDLALKIIEIVKNRKKYEPRREIVIQNFNEEKSLSPYLSLLE